MLSPFGDPFLGDTLFSRMQRLADAIKRDVEYQLDRTFDTFRVLEHRALEDPDQNSSYYLKIKTDNDGHVRVKTMQKEPHSDWKVNVEEYDRGNPALSQDESKKHAAAIGRGEKKENIALTSAGTGTGNPDDKNKAQMSPYRSFFDDPIFERMQRIADSVKRDVEDQLNRTFDTFRVLEHKPLEDPNQHSSYSMKIKTDDDGHVRVKTDQKQAHGDWKANVEEYNKGNPPAPGKDESPKKAISGQNTTALTSTSNQDDENKVRKFSPSLFGDSLFERMQQIANNIQRDVENQLHRTFETFKVLEHKVLHDPDQNASYYMKIKTDDNGHVRVKTMQKRPHSDWKVNVEEYDRGKAALGKDDSRKNVAIGQGEKRGNNAMEIENENKNKNQTQTANP